MLQGPRRPKYLYLALYRTASIDSWSNYPIGAQAMYLVKAAPNRHPLTCQQPPRVCRSQIPSIPPNLNTPAAPFPSKSTPYSPPKHPCGSGFPSIHPALASCGPSCASIGRSAASRLGRLRSRELGRSGTPVQPKTSPIAPQANPDPLISPKPTPLQHVCTYVNSFEYTFV